MFLVEATVRYVLCAFVSQQGQWFKVPSLVPAAGESLPSLSLSSFPLSEVHLLRFEIVIAYLEDFGQSVFEFGPSKHFTSVDPI